MPTKSALVDAIANRIGVVPPPMSNGASEPRAIFDLVAVELGLPIDPGEHDKQAMARAVCEAAEVEWSIVTCESSGGRVTKVGLERVLLSVERLMGD